MPTLTHITRISFLARKPAGSSLAGHAFVALVVEKDATLYVYEKLFGLYPREADGALETIKALLGGNPGVLVAGWNDLAWDVEYRVRVTQEQYDKLNELYEAWKEDTPKYSLINAGGINCTKFVSEVARILNLKIPGGTATTFPWRWIEELKKSN